MTAKKAAALFIAFSLAAIGCDNSKTIGPRNTAKDANDIMKGIVTLPASATPENLAERQAQVASKLQSAKEQISRKELDQGIANLEQCVVLDDKNTEVLQLLVESSRARSNELISDDPARSYHLMVQAGGYLQTLRQLKSDFTEQEKQFFATIIFEEACGHARSKRREEFSGALNAAIEAGFADLERLRSDASLEEFRKVPEMAKLIEGAAESIAKRPSAKSN